MSKGMPVMKYENAMLQPPINRYGIEQPAPKNSPCSAATIAQTIDESFLRIITATAARMGHRYIYDSTHRPKPHMSPSSTTKTNTEYITFQPKKMAVSIISTSKLV